MLVSDTTAILALTAKLYVTKTHMQEWSPQVLPSVFDVLYVGHDFVAFSFLSF